MIWKIKDPTKPITDEQQRVAVVSGDKLGFVEIRRDENKKPIYLDTCVCDPLSFHYLIIDQNPSFENYRQIHWYSNSSIVGKVKFSLWEKERIQ